MISLTDLSSAGGLGLIISVAVMGLVVLGGLRYLQLRLRRRAPESSAIRVREESAPAPFETRTHPNDVPTASDIPKDLRQALVQTKGSFLERLKSVFVSKANLTSDELEQIEEILYTSDLGPQAVQLLMSSVERRLASTREKTDFEAVRQALKTEMLDILNGVARSEPLHLDGHPSVWMIVGVNGAGKTTTIGKLAAQLAGEGKKVLVAAGDTFRAAAGSQLRVWTERAQVQIFEPPHVSDPSAVAFDACQMAKTQNFDVVIIDTAGRLHTAKNLMDELKKMQRVVAKVIATAPHETLLVLDANSGQNALIQAREFHQILNLTGVILTKLDGTAKGGVAVGVACELRLPIRLIGVGEKASDLRPFSANEFVDSII